MSDSAAKAIIAALTRSRREPAPVEGEFAKAVARKLESRGITRVPGAQVNADEPEWFDLAIEHDRRQKTLRKKREARREAEQEAQLPTAAKLHKALSGASTPRGTSSAGTDALSGRRGNAMPLNGESIVRAALAGGYGTIESRNE